MQKWYCIESGYFLCDEDEFLPIKWIALCAHVQHNLRKQGIHWYQPAKEDTI